MPPLRSSLAATFLALAALAACAAAPGSSVPPPQDGARARAVFAMGCFWCAETAFEGQPGVVSVVSGYTGGTLAEPTYHDVGTGRTGHAEAIEVVFDPTVTSFPALLERFWHNVDPTDGEGQFCDRGSQYRSAIFPTDEQQRTEAEASLAALAASVRLPGPIATRIEPAAPFFPAEAYHQDFHRKNPVRYRSYRFGCGRDARLKELWGDLAGR